MLVLLLLQVWLFKALMKHLHLATRIEAQRGQVNWQQDSIVCNSLDSPQVPFLIVLKAWVQLGMPSPPIDASIGKSQTLSHIDVFPCRASECWSFSLAPFPPRWEEADIVFCEQRQNFIGGIRNIWNEDEKHRFHCLLYTGCGFLMQVVAWGCKVRLVGRGC